MWLFLLDSVQLNFAGFCSDNFKLNIQMAFRFEKE